MNSSGARTDFEAIGKTLWQSGGDAHVVLRHHRIQDCCPLFLSWTQQQAGAVRGSDIDGFFRAAPDSHADDLAATLKGPRSKVVEVQLRHGGMYAPTAIELSSLSLGDGRLLLRMRDIALLRAAKNEVREKRAALEDALSGYNIIDATGHFTYANSAYLRMWGYDSLDELLGTSPAQHCADPDMPARIIEDVEKHGRTTVEFEARRKDGSTFVALMAVQLSSDPFGKKIYVGTSLDMSQMKTMQEELFHLRKMDALGGLAASLAHDFNNMLSPILGFTELVMADDGLSENNREQLEQVMMAAERSRVLTSRLLAFSRKQVLQTDTADLREVMSEMEGLIRQTLRENIRLILRLHPTQCNVRVDQTQIHQMIINLVTNAQDAMPHGGLLTIEVGRRVLDDAFCQEYADIEPGQFAEIIVSDTGDGLNAEAKQRLFEPYFTTKGEFGTGLGLASVHGIVKQHKGNIWVYSEPGNGTSFKIYLPLADPSASVRLQVPEPRSIPAGHNVLVVEDDELVRRVATRILSNAGYNVSDVGSVEFALTRIDAGLEPQLMLTDVVLPDGNGRDLAAEVQRTIPDLQVLYMSGYTDDVIGHLGVLDAGIDFLQKPFSARDLLAGVERLLLLDEQPLP